MRYFCRTVEAGSLTKAAEQLFVAQPALGMQIRQMEESVGVALLQRHARGVLPTRAGQVLYERACEILSLVEEAQRQVIAAGRFEAETIVLGLTNGFMQLAGHGLLQRVRAQLAGVKFGLVEERSLVLVDAVEKHEIDFALAYEVHERPSLLRIPLIEEDMLFLTRAQAGGPAGVVGDIPFARMVEHELVLPGHRDGVREQLIACAHRMALDLRVTLDVSSVTMMKNIVVHGDACAVMPYGNVVDELQRGTLCGHRIVEPKVRRTLYLVRPMSRAPFAHEDQLLQLIASAVQDMAARLGPLCTRLAALDSLGEAAAAARAQHGLAAAR